MPDGTSLIESSDLKQGLSLQLDAFDKASFSEKGFKELNHSIVIYINDLVDESKNIAKRSRADDISAVHVEKAAEYLASGTIVNKYRHLGTLGGVILGGGFSTILSIISSNSVNLSGLIITTASCVIGTAMVAVHIARD